MIKKLCVGAVSRRVVEEAAGLGVAQIVASRSQVNTRGGYTGMTQHDLVELVHRASKGATSVVRDHGGPNGVGDDGIAELEADVDAGFNALHLDVTLLDREKQFDALRALVDRFGERIAFEIGGEHDGLEWNERLMTSVVSIALPMTVVIDTGAYVWADRQCGTLLPIDDVRRAVDVYRRMGVTTKAHNMDWLGRRARYTNELDFFNVAPEVGAVEVDAILHTTPLSIRNALLNTAYDSGRWSRWYNDDEGTWHDRACTALRYMQLDPLVARLTSLDSIDDGYVRRRIRDALQHQ